MNELNNYDLITRTLKMREEVINLKDKIRKIRESAISINKYVQASSSKKVNDKVCEIAVNINDLNLILAQKFKVFIYLYSRLMEQCEKLLTKNEVDMVKLRVKSGLSVYKIAKKLDISNSTANRKINAINQKIIRYNKEKAGDDYRN